MVLRAEMRQTIIGECHFKLTMALQLLPLQEISEIMRQVAYPVGQILVGRLQEYVLIRINQLNQESLRENRQYQQFPNIWVGLMA